MKTEYENLIHKCSVGDHVYFGITDLNHKEKHVFSGIILEQDFSIDHERDIFLIELDHGQVIKKWNGYSYDTLFNKVYVTNPFIYGIYRKKEELN